MTYWKRIRFPGAYNFVRKLGARMFPNLCKGKLDIIYFFHNIEVPPVRNSPPTPYEMFVYDFPISISEITEAHMSGEAQDGEIAHNHLVGDKWRLAFGAECKSHEMSKMRIRELENEVGILKRRVLMLSFLELPKE